MTWEIIIHDRSLKNNIADKLEEISESLEKNCNLLGNNIGLLGGKIGVALFFFYYSRFSEKECHYDYALQLLSDVVDEANNGFMAHTFYAGLSGIGWVIESLSQNKFIEADTSSILKELDPIVFDSMKNDIRQGNYEFLHGALGAGVYFINRLASSPVNSSEYLIRLVDDLDKISRNDENSGINWISTFNDEKKITGFDLGLAHGIPGIIAFLTLAYSLDIQKEKVYSLLNGAVNFLLSQSLDPGIYYSHFPSKTGENINLTGSRMGWCYGDLGIGNVLWLASQATGNKEWSKKAIDVLIHSTGRRDPVRNSVHDACLCHGAAGIAHIYNRMYHYTRIPMFKDQAVYWFEQTLVHARFEDGYAGFKQWQGENHYIDKIDLLEGIAGIGLALLSGITGIEPGWDRLLLLS